MTYYNKTRHFSTGRSFQLSGPQKDIIMPYVIFAVYLIIVNIYAFAITVYDKRIAERNGQTGQKKRRVPERTLLIAAAAGGSLTMYITMKKIRHKTQHRKFMLGIPAIMAGQVLLLAALIILA